MPPLTPEIDDRYDLLEVMDDRGATVVYRARHRILGAEHVLRVLHAAAGVEDAARAAFRERAQAQAAVRHPAIVRVHNVYESDALIALAVDYLPGEDARARVARTGPLSARDAAAVVADLAEGLDVAHEAGVVHHELHPGLVRFPAGGGPPRLAHFSIRYLTTYDGPAIPFASPEELLRPGAGDARADVFSLGALLYFLLVGTPPFPVEGREDALQRRLLGGAPPAYAGDPALAAILRAAMGDRVGQRTPTAGALAEALHRWIERAAATRNVGPTLAPVLDLAPPIVAPPIVAPPIVAPPPLPVAAPPIPIAAPLPKVVTPVTPPPVSPAPAAVSEPSQPTATTPAVTATAPRPAGRGFPRGLVLAGVLAVGLLGLVVAGVAWHAWQVSESQRLAAEAMGMLQRFKTDAATNEDASVLADATRRARRAVEHAETPEALAAYGLARVWDERWHFAGATWDDAKFRATLPVVDAARDTGRAEGVFAHGLLTANACKLLPPSDTRREALCTAAADDYAAAGTLLRHDPRGWLRFELWWSLAAWNGQRALEALARQDTAAASAAWRDGLAVCELARPDLFAAPVNDAELGQECVTLAGGAGDLDAYLWWTDWLQDDDRAADGKLSSSNVERIYRGALPACGKLGVSKKNRRRKTLPETDGTGASAFCYAAGLLALGCDSAAAQVWMANAAVYPEQPWARLAGRTSNRSCYLDEP